MRARNGHEERRPRSFMTSVYFSLIEAGFEYVPMASTFPTPKGSYSNPDG
jgi:hypothetical protein